MEKICNPAVSFDSFEETLDCFASGCEANNLNYDKESIRNMALAAQVHMKMAVVFTEPAISVEENTAPCIPTVSAEAILPTETHLPAIVRPKIFYPNSGCQFAGKSSLVASVENIRKEGLSSDERLAGQIVEKLLQEVNLRLYRGRLFMYDFVRRIYVDIDADFDFYVNRLWGDMIRSNGSSRTYSEAKSLLKKEGRLLVDDLLTASPSEWAFQNGILSVHDGLFFQNDGSRFITGTFGCDYDPTATCPRFDQFIESVCCGEEKLIQRLWQVIGIILASDKKAKSFFLFYGPKDTGKSLLADLLTDIVGADRVSHLSASDFGERFETVALCEKVLNTSMDLPDEPLDNRTVAKIKSYTGDDPVHSQRKYRSSIDFKPTAVLLFGSNSMIRTKAKDAAFEDRLVAIPFNNPVPKEQQNKYLREELLAEASGIVLKAAMIYHDLVMRNYAFTDVDIPTTQVVDPKTAVRIFVDEAVQSTGRDTDLIATNDLHKAYSDFCTSRELPSLAVDRFSTIFSSLVQDKATKCRKRLNGEPNPISAFAGIVLK